MQSEQKAQDPPGAWFWRFDPRTIHQAIRSLKSQSEWINALATSTGCPVFKADPGWRSLMVTDKTAAEQVFNAFPDEFDRDDGFMNSNLDHERMLENVLPAFMTAEGPDGSGPHRAARAFIQKALAARGGFSAFAAVCSGAMDGAPGHADSAELPLAKSLAENATNVMCRWYLGMDGLDGNDAQDWVNGMLYTRGDKFPMGSIIGRLKSRPGKDLTQYSAKLLAAVRESEHYDKFVAVAREVGLPEKDVAPHLLVSCLLNAGSPPFAVGQPAIAQLYKDPELRARLAKEVEGVSDAAELAKLPLLDGFFVESMRFFGKPTRTSRKAMRDTTLTLGDGRVIKVAKGTSVQIIHSSIRDDKSIMADPEKFRPERFVADESLKRKMYTFGAYDTRERPTSFHCPGAEAGVAQLLWKISVLPFIKDGGATIKENYQINKDDNGNNCTSPKNLTWVRSA